MCEIERKMRRGVSSSFPKPKKLCCCLLPKMAAGFQGSIVTLMEAHKWLIWNALYRHTTQIVLLARSTQQTLILIEFGVSMFC